jgi:hypothetical protein
MAVDSRQQQMGSMGYDPLRYPAPHFTNPWASQTSAAAAPSSLYPTSMAAGQSSGLDNAAQQAHSIPRSSAVSSIPYASSIPVTAAPLGSGTSLPLDGIYGQQNLLDIPQEVLNPSRSYASQVSSVEAPVGATYAPTSAPQYAMDYSQRATYDYAQDAVRRGSHP